MLIGDVGVIIPAFNEADFIGITLKALKNLEIINDVLVVDDGSWDRTGEIALKAGARLITLDKNMGKGHALQVGIENMHNGIIVFLDADVGETAKEITNLVLPLLENRAEVTIGKIAFTKGKGGFGLVKGLSQIAFKSLTGTKCSSVLSGQRAFKKEILSKDLLKYKRYGIEFGMTVDLYRQGINIMEVPLEINHRVTGRDYMGFKHRSKQFWDILMVILAKN